jgi:two-component SAPR family response regulator
MESLDGADPRRLRSLRRTAAEYHLEKGSTEQAVDLLVESGSLSRAGKLAERFAEDMFEQGRIQTLERWAEVLRQDSVSIPNVHLFLARSKANRGDLDSAETMLAEANKSIIPKASKDLRARAEIATGFISYERGAYAAAIDSADRLQRIYAKRKNRRYLGMGLRIKALAVFEGQKDPALAEELVTQAVDCFMGPGGDYQRAAALVDLSMYQEAQGKLQQANVTGAQVLELARQIGAPLPLAVAYGNQARGAHQAGDYESALRYSRESLKYSRQSANPLREAIAVLRQADVFNDIGLTLQAAELYRQALDILLELDDVQWIRYGCVQASVLHRRRGGVGVAHEWLKRAIVVEDSKKPPSSVRIQQSALELQASAEHAIKNLRMLVRKGAQNLEAEELTLVYYFLARAAFEMKNEGRSIQDLAEALSLAGRFGAEQVIAAELRFDAGFAEFTSEHFKSDPTFLLIRNRIDTLMTLERRYESSVDEEPGELTLAFEALGVTRVFVNGAEVKRLKPMATEILYYLLDRGRVARDQLMEAFWPEQAPGRQVSSLHTAIYSIRRELGKEAIHFDGTLYRIDPERSVQYDVAKFEQAASIAEGLPPGDPRSMFALTEAVNLYGGQFLPEFDSEWVNERRRELELRYLDLLANYSEEALIRGRASEAVGWLREALSLDPLRDDTNRYYLEALGRLGRRSEIVVHYQEYVRVLAEELGLDPPEEVRELYDRLIS